MTRPIEIIAEQFPELTIFDGLDDAIIGVGTVNQEQAVVYDETLVIEILKEDMKLDEHEANEWFQFNISGAYVGPSTPIFMVQMEELL
jgi:hypothetical protein